MNSLVFEEEGEEIECVRVTYRIVHTISHLTVRGLRIASARADDWVKNQFFLHDTSGSNGFEVSRHRMSFPENPSSYFYFSPRKTAM